MARKGITGTDVDLTGGLPVSPYARKRGEEVQALVAALDALNLVDPAVQAFRNSVKAQAEHVGSVESEVDVDDPDTKVVQDTDSDTSTETGGGDAESTETAEVPELAKLKADHDRAVAFVKEVDSKQREELESSGAWAYLERLAQMPWQQVVTRLGGKNAVNPEKTVHCHGL